jgi:hypothetical protein
MRSLAPLMDAYDLALKPIPPIVTPAVPIMPVLMKSLLFVVFMFIQSMGLVVLKAVVVVATGFAVRRQDGRREAGANLRAGPTSTSECRPAVNTGRKLAHRARRITKGTPPLDRRVSEDAPSLSLFRRITRGIAVVLSSVLPV